MRVLLCCVVKRQNQKWKPYVFELYNTDFSPMFIIVYTVYHTGCIFIIFHGYKEGTKIYFIGGTEMSNEFSKE